MTSMVSRIVASAAAAWVVVASLSAAGINRLGDALPQAQLYQDPTHETTTADVPGLTTATSACGTSGDETYGTKANPIRIGGGPLYMASREIKYFSALRGPAGQGVHFKRGGSTPGEENTILDGYVVEYKGLDHAVSLYVDAYHWDTPLAPKGWLCGVPMNLVAPGPDTFETARQLRAFGVSLAPNPVEPISVDPDGSRAHGIVFDYVRLMGLAAREAVKAGVKFKGDGDELPPGAESNRTVVIAFPIQCEGALVRPEAISLSDASGRVPPETGKATGAKIAELVRGYSPPEGALAVSYAVPALIEGARVSIRYAAECGTQARDLLLPVRSERARVLKSLPGVLPSGVTVPPAGAQVRVQVVVDASGTPQFPVYDAGPWALRNAAIAAAREWRVEPPKVNGAPVFDISGLAISFKSSAAAPSGALPVPVLELRGSEDSTANGQSFTRYLFNVSNRAAFPDVLFAPAPDLPPCGANTNASRTWVDIFATGGRRLYGFCAMRSANDLGTLSFVVPKGQAAPTSVYVTFTDRRDHVTVSSNTVDIR
jgi:hypothetical protein